MSSHPLPIHPLSSIQPQSIQTSNLENASSLHEFMSSAFDSDTPEERRKREDEAFLQELKSTRLPIDIDIDRQIGKTEKELKKIASF